MNNKDKMEKGIKEAAVILSKAKKVTVLTGAGISAESGIATYRDKDNGLWNKWRAQDMATLESFERDPAIVWEWYGERQQIVLKSEPNPAHITLAQLEKRYDAFNVVTQNIDGLHQRGGSTHVLELHGNLLKARCTKEETVFDFILGNEKLPKCPKCGAIIRPHVVWFGEALDPVVLKDAFRISSECDAFIMIGTSAQVQPAASLPLYAIESGASFIEINGERTHLSRHADVYLEGKAGEILPEIYKLM